MSLLGWLEHGVVRLNQFVCGTLLAASCALVFANVVLRYGFGVSLAWAEEAARYMMIWAALLGAGLALRAGAHIAVDILPEALPELAARVLRAIILLAVAGFLVLLAELGMGYAEFAMMQRTPVLRLPQGWIYMAIPIGCMLMLAHLLMIARDFILRPKDEDQQVRAAEMGSL